MAGLQSWIFLKFFLMLHFLQRSVCRKVTFLWETQSGRHVQQKWNPEHTKSSLLVFLSRHTQLWRSPSYIPGDSGLLQRSWDPAWHVPKPPFSEGLRMLQRVNRQRWNVLTDHLTKVGLWSTHSAFWLSDVFLALLSQTCLPALASSSSLPLIDFSWALCRGWLMSKTWAQLFTTETCVYFTEGCFLCFYKSGRASFYPWQCLFRRWKVI